MKKLLATILFALISIVSYAQIEPTTFMGIPIDGSESSFIQKLKAKGFTPSLHDSDVLTGEFNGFDVNVFVKSNKGKVWRVMVCQSTPTDESNIKVQFNTLCRQFNNNPKYANLLDKDFRINDDTDISYEMSVNNKSFEALFYQYHATADTTYIKDVMINYVKEYGKGKEFDASDTTLVKEEENKIIDKTFDIFKSVISNRPVWFRIMQYGAQYYLAIYYDNELNSAHGEDL